MMVGVAGVITKSSIDRVKQSTDIVELVGGYIPLKKSGGSYVACCPFHQEKTPSFHVNPSRQMYHCFGCQRGGDSIAFVMEHEGLGFSEAVERLARRLGISIEYEQGRGGIGPEERSIKEKLFSVQSGVSDWWHRLLVNDEKAAGARDYLTGRGVSQSSIENFGLGYSPDSWDEVSNWGKSHGADEDLLVLSGLMIRKEESGRVYSRFRGRLMFPIHDIQGRVVGFSARVLDPEKDQGAKYINSPETPVFKKNQVLFGLHRARKAILDRGFVLICEGQLDTISLHAHGFTNSVAPQGTALGEGHLRILKRLTTEIVLCFDSDGAGQKAAARVSDDLLKLEMTASVVSIPEGHDPDSFLKEFGPEAFQKRLDDRVNYFDFLLGHWKMELDMRSSPGRRELVQRMGKLVQLSADPLLIEDAARKTALAVQTKASVIQESWRKQRARVNQMASRDSEVPVQEGEAFPENIPEDIRQESAFDINHISRNEIWLLRLLLSETKPEFTSSAVQWVKAEWIASGAVREVFETWCRQVALPQSDEDENVIDQHDGPEMDLDIFLEQLADGGVRQYCRSLIVKGEQFPDPIRQLQDVATKLRNTALDFRIGQLTQEASREGLSNEETGIILRMQQALRDQKRLPLDAPGAVVDEADLF